MPLQQNVHTFTHLNKTSFGPKCVIQISTPRLLAWHQAVSRTAWDGSPHSPANSVPSVSKQWTPDPCGSSELLDARQEPGKGTSGEGWEGVIRNDKK